MPLYSFVCSSCKNNEQKFVNYKQTSITCSKCSSLSTRQLPTLNGPSNVTEIVDKYTGIAHRRDQKDEVKERREEYYWTVEVPRLVDSGTYSLETMLNNGWIWVDDNNQIHKHTKPPHKR